MTRTQGSATHSGWADAAAGRRADAPDAARSGDADARRGAHQAPPPGRADAVVAGAERVSDAVMEVGEALVAAVLGAVVGAGRTARGIWVADRPRRQRERMWRRRRWLHRKGWWRVAVILELVGIGAWLGGRAAVRAVRGVPVGAAEGARTGWATGRDRAQTRHATRRGGPATGGATGPGPAWGTPGPSTSGPVSGSSTASSGGESIVDAEILCSRSGCGTVLAPDDSGPLCPACRQARTAAGVGGDDVQVSVEVTSPTGPDPAAPVGGQEDTPDPWPPVTAEPDAARRLVGDGPMDIGDPDTWVAQAVPGLPQRQECTWLGADGRFCGAGDPPPGELFCAHHGTSSPEDEEEDDVLDRAHDRVGQRVRHLRWNIEGTVTGAWEDGELAVRFDGCEFTEEQCSPNDLEVVTGPGSGSYRPTDAGRRAAGWTGPIDSDGHAVHGEPKWAVPQHALAPQSPAGHPAGGPAGRHDRQDGPGHPAGPDDENQEDGMGTDTTEMTIMSGAGGTSVTGGARMGGELTAIGDLRAEVTELRRYAETGVRMLTDLEEWAAGLPDQVAGADWSTEAVTAAAVGLAEARTVEEVRQGITGLLQAAAAAERLGEQLAAGGARRGVAGLRPQ